MAQLLPADFDLTQLEYSEQRTCRSFLDGLDDTWFVVPKVLVLDAGKDAEIDIVLASAAHGVLLVEVKGGKVELVTGQWMQNGRPMKKAPTEQVTSAKHHLVRRMKGIGIDTHGLFMAHAIALPDTGAIPAEGMGLDAPKHHLFGHYELADPARAIGNLLTEHGPVQIERFTRFLRALRPDIRVEGADTAVMPVATRRIDDATRARLGALQTLDANARVLVTGGAGTGKTWLVVEWARRAAARGERTLVLTFNKPLADDLTRVLDGTGVEVHTYHDLIVHLAAPFGFAVVDKPNRDYWETVPTQALLDHAADVGTPFDTIIIDEGQDMRPHWLPSIEMLLDPAAAKARLLMVADPSQAIYVDPWEPPAGMMLATLEENLRSARSVAEVVHHLGGPKPMSGAVGEVEVTHLRAGGLKEVRKRVRSTIESLRDEHGVPLSQIAVLTLRIGVRDHLLDAQVDVAAEREPLPVARWEQRSEDTVLCETVHRGKGLERAAVIVVDITDTPEPQLVYIGASRAMWSLTLVGKDVLAEVAGVKPQR
ncbi:MAG: hypothetical protein RLZZ362_1766 [Actinomycetota bacterium]